MRCEGEMRGRSLKRHAPESGEAARLHRSPRHGTTKDHGVVTRSVFGVRSKERSSAFVGAWDDLSFGRLHEAEALWPRDVWRRPRPPGSDQSGTAPKACFALQNASRPSAKLAAKQNLKSGEAARLHRSPGLGETVSRRDVARSALDCGSLLPLCQASPAGVW